MKKLLFGVFALFLCVSVYFIYINANNNAENNIITKKARIVYNLYSQIGDEILIEADKLVGATGFAGSSNHVFYLIDSDLYYRNISSITNEEELIATGVEDLFLENINVIAKLKDGGKVLISNSYISYK